MADGRRVPAVQESCAAVSCSTGPAKSRGPQRTLLRRQRQDEVQAELGFAQRNLKCAMGRDLGCLERVKVAGLTASS